MNLTWAHWIVLGFSILKMGLFTRFCLAIRQSAFRVWVLIFSGSILLEYFGAPGLSMVQWLVLGLAIAGLFFPSKAIDRVEFAAMGVGWLLWAYLLRDVAFIPSADDGVHHLFYYDRMRTTGHLLTGHIPLLRSTTFGQAFLTYYPSGFHAFASVLEFPLTDVLQLPSWIALKVEVLWVLASFFPLVYRLSLAIFPGASRAALAIAVLFCGMLEVFPSNAIAEGGISRVAGLVFVVWALLEFLGSRTTRGVYFSFLGLVLPLAFWIHPSAIVHLSGAIVLIGLSEGRRPWIPWFVEISTGLLVFAAWVWGFLHSGPSVLLGAGGVSSALTVLPLSGSAWIDRLKGPVHYFLRDPFVPGRFFSPRMLLFYLGAQQIAKQWKQKRWIAVLFFFFAGIPFVLALLQFSAFPPFVALGMFYYHSVKRMAEFFVLPLFLGWCAGLLYLWPMRRARAVLGVVCGLTLVFGIPALNAGIVASDRSFGSVSDTQLNHARMMMENLSRAESGTWYCEGRRYQPLMRIGAHKRVDFYFTQGTECASGKLHDAYCTEEAKYFEAQLKKGLSNQTATWVSFGQGRDGCYWLK